MSRFGTFMIAAAISLPIGFYGPDLLGGRFFDSGKPLIDSNKRQITFQAEAIRGKAGKLVNITAAWERGSVLIKAPDHLAANISVGDCFKAEVVNSYVAQRWNFDTKGVYKASRITRSRCPV